MKKVVGPAASRYFAKLSFTPRTTADIATTTKTPTATPMIVRPARTLFARMTSKAIFTPSPRLVNVVRSAMPLLLPQSGDGIQLGGTARRVHPRHDADGGAEERREHDRPGSDARWQRGRRRDAFREPVTEEDADDRAEGAERRGLDEELPEDVAPLGPQRLPDADLAR